MTLYVSQERDMNPVRRSRSEDGNSEPGQFLGAEPPRQGVLALEALFGHDRSVRSSCSSSKSPRRRSRHEIGQFEGMKRIEQD